MRSSNQTDRFQRAVAASLAISARWSAVSLVARDAAPFRPPERPRVTAAGSFPSSNESTTRPVAMSPTNLASWIGSRGRGSRLVAMR